MTKFGLDWPAVSAVNPALIMLSISGFGQHGSESQRAAYAPIIHAESGILPPGLGGHATEDIALSAADVLSGMHGVIGVLSALRVREATGVGQHIDMAMLDAMTFSNDQIVKSLDGGRPAEHIGGEVWDTAVGPMMLTGGLRWIWHQMSNTHGLVDATAADADVAMKVTARRRLVTDFLCSQPDRNAVIAVLDEANLAWADLRYGPDVLTSPTLAERDSIATIPDRAGSTRQVIRAPYRMSGSDTSDVGVAPFRGEHNLEVLVEWLDLDVDAVAVLAGVLHTDEWADALDDHDGSTR